MTQPYCKKCGAPITFRAWKPRGSAVGWVLPCDLSTFEPHFKTCKTPPRTGDRPRNAPSTDQL
jgi:hypothetical protein